MDRREAGILADVAESAAGRRGRLHPGHEKNNLDPIFIFFPEASVERLSYQPSLPLAVGFGVREKADAEFLKGKAGIAVIGSETTRVAKENGVSAARESIRSILCGGTLYERMGCFISNKVCFV